MRKLFLILMTLVAVSWTVSAQIRTYSGTVVDAANNEPLIGATIMPIGGGQGAATDVDGKFTVSVPANVKNVKVSYIGYKEQTLPLKENMTVYLASTSTNLDDVVVVAYGTANKESLTGSVAVVGSQEIEERPVTNVVNALEGNAPGVNVNSSTGYPGSSPSIRIRGYNSFSSSAQGPLYVVDGVIFSGDLSDINPYDVESMSVLKDAASCALYGARGANGVILITTKRAKNTGRVDVNLNMSWGWSQLTLPLYDRLGANDWMEASLMGMANGEAYANGTSYETALLSVKNSIVGGAYMLGSNPYGTYSDGIWTQVANADVFNDQGKIADGVAIMPGYTDLNWWDAITRTGARQEYNLSAAGGTEKFDIYSSVGYLTNKGYVIDQDYERMTGRFTANYNPVSYFRTGMKLDMTYSEQSFANVDADDLNLVVNPFLTMFKAPTLSVYEHDENGNIVRNVDGTPVYNIGGMASGNNVIQATKLNKENQTQLSMNGSIYGTAVLPYGFEATVQGSLFRQKIDWSSYSNNQEGSQKGVGGLDEEFYNLKNYTFEQYLTWNHDYGDHHVDAFLRHSNYKIYYGYSYVRASGQKLDNLYALSNFDEITSWQEIVDNGYTMEEYMGRARYDYNQKYFADFSVTRQGTSQFAKDHRWGTFWSAGASWIISKEKFMQDLNWVDYLKLRLSYGTAGNNTNASYINYLTTFGFLTSGGLYLNQNANENLKWEAVKTFDVALEGYLFDNRFRFGVGYFNKVNSDLIFSLPIAQSAGTSANSGYVMTIPTNVGSMVNYGWELDFGVDIIRTRDWIWDFNIDASFIVNKIKKLPNGENMPSSGLFKGQSRYVNYTYEWAGVDQMNGRSLYYMNPDSPDFYAYDEDHNIYYDEATYNSYVQAAKDAGSYVEIDGVAYTYDVGYAGRKIMGKINPTVYGSFSTGLSWKGLRLNLLFTYSLGGKCYDSNYAAMMTMTTMQGSALHKDVLKGWTSVPEGMTEDSSDRIKKMVPQLNSILSSQSTASSSQYLTSASYLSLKNISLTYDLPRKWTSAMKLSNINVGFLVENAFILTARKGFNSSSAIGGSLGSSGAYYQPYSNYTFQIGVRF